MRIFTQSPQMWSWRFMSLADMACSVLLCTVMLHASAWSCCRSSSSSSSSLTTTRPLPLHSDSDDEQDMFPALQRTDSPLNYCSPLPVFSARKCSLFKILNFIKLIKQAVLGSSCCRNLTFCWVMGKHVSDWWRHVMTFDLWRTSVTHVVILHPSTKFDVRRPSFPFRRYNWFSVTALIGLVTLTFCLVKWVTGHACHGLPSCQFSALYALLFST